MKFILDYFLSRLWIKLACILMLLVGIPLSVMGVKLVNTADDYILSSIKQDYVKIAEYAAGEVSSYINRPQELLTVTRSMLSSLSESLWNQETILVELALHYPSFLRVSVFDLNGRETVTSEAGDPGRWTLTETELEVLRQGNKYVSSLEFKDGKIPFMVIAMPMVVERNLKGFIAAEVNMRGMWDIIDSVRIGQTGTAFLVSADGTLLAHHDKKRVLRHDSLAEREDVCGVIDGRSGSIKFCPANGNGCLFSAFVPIKDLSWGLIIEQESKEALAASYMMRSQTTVIIIISILFAFGASVAMAKILARPIGRLLDHFNMLSAGIFKRISNIKRKDELGNLLRAFNDTAEQLEEQRRRDRRAIIGDAASWMAHELKNGLASIKTFVHYFPKRHGDPEFIERFNVLVPEELERFERLLKQFSGYSHRSGSLSITCFSLHEFINNVGLLMEETLREKNVSLGYDLPHDRIMINADIDRLRQVFINLYLNAVKAMPEGGNIKLSARIFTIGNLTDVHWVEITVKDTGKGIEPERMKYIFKPFHTTGDSESGNMGLGLPICRSIIEQHGGSIKVESTLGQGAAFILCMPLSEISRRSDDKR